MVCCATQMKNLAVLARDGEIGKVVDLLFDDHLWAIRHLVVDTGGWLTGKRVLLSPHSVEFLRPDEGCVQVALARKQVEGAPEVDTDRPVSRQQEAALYDYYGYPYYWAGGGAWGAAGLPVPFPAAGRAGGVMGAAAHDTIPPPSSTEGDPNLRSCEEVMGYCIEASDGSIGHVEDFMFDPSSWHLRHIMVDTRNWLPGRHVLVDPASILAVDWNEREVRVRLTRKQVKAAPQPQDVT